MIIELLSREHRNIERLLAVLEHELDIFDRADRPDYEVIRAIIAYFEVYTEMYHHHQEDRDEDGDELLHRTDGVGEQNETGGYRAHDTGFGSAAGIPRPG